MDGVRKHFGVGLLLLTCALTSHCSESATVAVTDAAAASAGMDAPLDLRLVLIVKHVEDSRSHLSAKTEAPLASRVWTSPTGSKDLRNLKTARRVKAVGLLPADLRKKDKFIQYLTGPLYFGPKCRKHVYKVYHHNRDCTIPMYFKRCARLLKRLAVSPQCTEG
ncbi:aLK and LTK ligand 2a [Takifugu rubripes]|uniref:ALK and LTK ligand 2-like n=1 Tax=Takifugu rubripes TaxID=31033 RepID=A0A674PKR2_TAKRU|nr:ALK and LTK ligand 2-like [Takifugu rubripes]